MTAASVTITKFLFSLFLLRICISNIYTVSDSFKSLALLDLFFLFANLKSLYLEELGGGV